MSESDRPSTAVTRVITAILATFLVASEIPIRVMEHAHLLESLKETHPVFYTGLMSPVGTLARWSVGILMILWLIFEKRSEPVQHAAAVSAKAQEPAPTAQVPNITISPTFNNSPVFTQQVSNHAPETVRPQLQISEPNLLFLRTQKIELGYDAYQGREIFYESDGRLIDRTDPSALLACFRNEPSAKKKCAAANNVQAQLIYKDADGKEIGNGISWGCWLNEPTDMVDFPVGDTHCVILIAHRNGHDIVPFKRRSVTSSGDVIPTQTHVFEKANVRMINVRLIDDNNDLLIEVEVSWGNSGDQINARVLG